MSAQKMITIKSNKQGMRNPQSEFNHEPTAGDLSPLSTKKVVEPPRTLQNLRDRILQDNNFSYKVGDERPAIENYKNPMLMKKQAKLSTS